MNWRCRWLGHKRRPLDGDGNGVSIRNIDACDRCGHLLRAKKARTFSYVDTTPAPQRVYFSRIEQPTKWEPMEWKRRGSDDGTF